MIKIYQHGVFGNGWGMSLFIKLYSFTRVFAYGGSLSPANPECLQCFPNDVGRDMIGYICWKGNGLTCASMCARVCACLLPEKGRLKEHDQMLRISYFSYAKASACTAPMCCPEISSREDARHPIQCPCSSQRGLQFWSEISKTGPLGP